MNARLASAGSAVIWTLLTLEAKCARRALVGGERYFVDMDNKSSARVAPIGLAMPEYVEKWLGSRDKTIVDHGFSAEELALPWWERELPAHGFAQATVTTNPNRNGSTRLTRGELFAMAPASSGSDEDVATFLFHVLAWGSGTSHRQNRKRTASIADASEGATRINLLREAAAEVRRGGPEAARLAYSSLIRRGGGVIPGLGPAFFTKFLYFAGAGKPTNPCLILDARVSKSLHGAGWDTLPRHRTKSGWSYSANWYTDTYVSYCETLSRWAAENNARPDEIERALFEGGPPKP